MNTRTIETLLEIMADTDMGTRRRIEAAEAILGYEAPTDTVSRTREFLISVFENKEETISDRMDAMKISQKFGAKRIAPQTVHMTRREEADRKEAWREYEISQLQIKIVLARWTILRRAGTTTCEAPTTCPLLAMSGLPLIGGRMAN